MKLEAKTILITGGTSGIGEELARQLLAKGNTVIVTGRDEAKIDALRGRLPGVHTFQSDVSDPQAIASLHDQVIDQFPNLDCLVNNAGIMRNLDLNEPHDLVDLTREIEINLDGPIRMVQQFLPHLKTRSGAAIVNVSSGLAFIPFAISPVYSAAKAAIHAYTQCLRVQLDGTSVTVIELAPPGVETKLYRDEFADELKGTKGMDVKVLAERAIAGIEAGKLEISPGQASILRVMRRLAPGLMFAQLTRMSRPKAG